MFTWVGGVTSHGGRGVQEVVQFIVGKYVHHVKTIVSIVGGVDCKTSRM